MPTGVRYAQITMDNLPRDLGKVYPISQQLNIWGEEDYKRDGSIEYLGRSEFGNYDKFVITYSIIQHVIGFYKEQKVENLLVEVHNNLYVSDTGQYILVKAPKKDIDKILNMLTSNGYIECSERELNLKDFKEKLDLDKTKIKSVVGAWFTNLENINVNTVAIFGTEIDLSDEFDDYASQDSSKISELIIDFGGETIAITSKYGAIFYNRRTEEKILEGYKIVTDLLESCGMF